MAKPQENQIDPENKVDESGVNSLGGNKAGKEPSASRPADWQGAAKNPPPGGAPSTAQAGAEGEEKPDESGLTSLKP